MEKKQIISPLPGIFYRKPSPEASEYKKEGDRVVAGDIIGLIEVMKSFHEVKSDVAGTIATFLVENEDTVMAGQPIADITP